MPRQRKPRRTGSLRDVGINGMAALMIVPLVFGTSAFAEAPKPMAAAIDGSGFCPTFPKPTISLDYGSRYDTGSVNRSELDVDSDADVTAALANADEFIRQLDGLANEARVNPSLAETRADCVISGIDGWADAGAFGTLSTENAKMTYASRIGGIASAYRQVMDMSKAGDRKIIEHWFAANAAFMIDYWDNDAPPMARLGNLRLWAAYAVTEIGLILDRQDFIDWARQSQSDVLATEAEDGSLPYEMRRGAYALHYQLHALAPLTASVALLCHTGHDYGEDEQAAIRKAVGFALEAIADPSKVVAITGVDQSVPVGLENQDTFTIAWLEAYLSLVTDGNLDRDLAPLRPLVNSKLGGDLTLIYRNNPKMQPGCFSVRRAASQPAVPSR